jgi:hypothetical protein
MKKYRLFQMINNQVINNDHGYLLINPGNEIAGNSRFCGELKSEMGIYGSNDNSRGHREYVYNSARSNLGLINDSRN